MRQEPPAKPDHRAPSQDAHRPKIRDEDPAEPTFPPVVPIKPNQAQSSLIKASRVIFGSQNPAKCDQLAPTPLRTRLSKFPIPYSLFLILSLAAVPTPSPPGDDAAGQALAEKIRSSIPTENLERHAVLLIDSKAGDKEIPVDCQVIVHPESGNWETIYQTTATNQQPADRLVITHIAGEPNRYEYDNKVLAPADTEVPFAGSDYSIGELGLEFLHWPGQTQLKGEMRLGQPCYVLQSTNTPEGGIVRVKSYIDKDSYGLLIAEAYDTNGSLIKKFSLHGSSFIKVNGQYQLEKMEIENEKTGSHTVLKFDMPKNP